MLEILCLKWGGTDLYVERLMHFAIGVPWDGDGDLRQTACKILGSYICSFAAGVRSACENTRRKVCGIRELLRSLAQDPESDEELRATASAALLKAESEGKKETDSKLPPAEMDT